MTEPHLRHQLKQEWLEKAGEETITNTTKKTIFTSIKKHIQQHLLTIIVGRVVRNFLLSKTVDKKSYYLLYTYPICNWKKKHGSSYFLQKLFVCISIKFYSYNTGICILLFSELFK